MLDKTMITGIPQPENQLKLMLLLLMLPGIIVIINVSTCKAFIPIMISSLSILKTLGISPISLFAMLKKLAEVNPSFGIR